MKNQETKTQEKKWYNNKFVVNLLFAILLMLIYSCSNPLDNKYSEETLEQDAEKIKESGELNSTELSLLGEYIAWNKMTGKKIEGRTYAEMLEEAKEIRKKQEEEKREQKELAEKARKEEEKRIAKLNQVLTVSIFDIGAVKKGYVGEEWIDEIIYHFVYENKSDKEIRAIKRTIIINDVFGDEIKKLGVKCDKNIQAGKIIKEKRYYNYNDYKKSDKKIVNSKMKDLKFIWKPEIIMYTDGSSLE